MCEENREIIDYAQITPKVKALSEKVKNNSIIDPELYIKYDVKRGLRDNAGNGVVTGITSISDVRARDENGNPCAGEILYRGINIKSITDALAIEDRFGFEETTYLLLFGDLPNKSELKEFEDLLDEYRSLPSSFVRDIILKKPSYDLMNSIAKGVLTLYSYDTNPDDISIENVLRQSLQLIARLPLLATYAYQASSHYNFKTSLHIHHPQNNLSTAENILYLLRDDNKYTKLEAKVLDLALILHAEHGGGNNSTFITRVATSTGTDTYSAIAAAIGSLKGPKHGGANIKALEMIEDLKSTLNGSYDINSLTTYLNDILDKKAFDMSGSIYGIGHAIYSESDPRAQIFKLLVEQLAKEKGLTDEYKLYATVEKLAPELIAKKRKMYKGISANVDFYSGFAYKMLGLPVELYTPIFAIARMTGWCAHRLEELVCSSKIIRPAYVTACSEIPYVKLDNR